MYKVILGFTVLVLLSFKSYCQCSNVNLAGARPQSAAFCSSSGDITDAWRAFDTDESADQTRWQPADQGMTHYVGIDLGTAYNVCSIYIRWGSLDYATDFKIQGSNDTTGTWTDLLYVTNNTQSELTITNFPTTGTYRYVRALMLHRVYDWSSYNVYNFEIYSRVANIPPDVTLNSPLNGASYQEGTTIDMSASVADNDGTVSKVEFYQGTTKIGEDTTAPYTFSWTNVATGAYNIEAKAIDNGGAYTWTDPAHITVTPASDWALSGNSGTNTSTKFLGTTDSIGIVLKTNNKERGRITAAGNLHLGTALTDTASDNGAKLQVHGQVAIDSLKTGLVSDSVIVVNNNFLKKVAASSIGAGSLVYTNGLSSNTGPIKLGGPLTNNTVISNADSSLSFLFNDSSYHKIGSIGSYKGTISKFGVGQYQTFQQNSVSPTDYWNENWTFDTVKHSFIGESQETYWGFKWDVGHYNSPVQFTPRPQITRNTGDLYGRLRFMEYQRAGLVIDTVDASGVASSPLFQVSFDGVMRLWVSPPTGASTDSLLVWDANTKIVKKIAAGSASGNWSVSGNNISNANTGIVSIGALPNPLPSDPNLKLAVNGNIYAKKLKITQTGWPDYVFDSSYHLRPLQEVESFIQQHQHLPEVPSAAEVSKNGLDVGDQQSVLLKKLEELTLYIIEQNKKQDEQNKLISQMREKIEKLEKTLIKNKTSIE